MAPTIAGIQPLISKPFITPAEILKIIALTTKVKKPRVMMLIGRVKKSRIGFNNILKRPTTMAAIIALGNDVIVIPGTIRAVT